MTAVPAWMTTRIDHLIGRGDHYATRETLSTRLPRTATRPRSRSDLRAAVADLIEHATVIITRTNPVWDGIDVAAPGRGVPVVAATRGPAPTAGLPSAPVPDFHLLRTCPICGARISQDCTTAAGKVTRPHKARREQT